MSIYNIKTIDLGKREEGSDYWISDVNDNKMQEIATAIGTKVNVVTSGSRWILYRGDDIHNTTGWEFLLSNDYLYVYPIIQNINPYQKDDRYVTLTRSNDLKSPQANTAKFHYVSCKNNNVVFGISHILDTTLSVEDLYFNIMSGKDVNDNSNRIIYAYRSSISQLYTDVSISSEADNTNISSGIQNDFIVLAPYAIPNLHITCEGVYWPLFGKNVDYYSNNYGFELNNKKYFVPNAENTQKRIVLELPDSAS